MLYRHSESQAWRSEDEEPIEVLGDQVIWPQGAKLWRVHRGCSAVKKLGLIGETMEKPGFYRGKIKGKTTIFRGNYGETSFF